MTDNPLYDSSSIIYDTIPEIIPLNKQTDTQHTTSLNSSNEPLLPPAVPPPRDSAAASTTVPRLPLPRIPTGGDKEEYVEMSSPMTPKSMASPRYTEAPTLKICGDQPSKLQDANPGNESNAGSTSAVKFESLL